MHDEATEAELRTQFERDKAAFGALSSRERRWAEQTAALGFGARKAFVFGGRGLLSVAEIVFAVPYILLGKAAAFTANGSIYIFKSLIGGLTNAGRAALATGRGVLALGIAGLDALKSAGLFPELTDGSMRQTLSDLKGRLHDLRGRLIEWREGIKEKIDRAWSQTKEDLLATKDWLAVFMERYGAIGLYRATRWALNPRRPSGGPLLGHEGTNRALSFLLALVGFVGLTGAVLWLGALGKIWHFKVMQMLITDSAPLYIQFLKQATIHPLITLGITAVKFFGLPAVAATRQTLKTLAFAQGIAYCYNVALKAQRAKKLEEAAQKKQKRSGRGTSVIGGIKTNSLSFIERFIRHVIAKATPEHYEARIKHYEAQKAAHKAGATPDASSSPTPAAQDTTAKAEQPSTKTDKSPSALKEEFQKDAGRDKDAPSPKTSTPPQNNPPADRNAPRPS